MPDPYQLPPWWSDSNEGPTENALARAIARVDALKARIENDQAELIGAEGAVRAFQDDREEAAIERMQRMAHPDAPQVVRVVIETREVERAFREAMDEGPKQ